MASHLERSVDFFTRRQEKIQEQMVNLMEDAVGFDHGRISHRGSESFQSSWQNTLVGPSLKA